MVLVVFLASYATEYWKQRWLSVHKAVVSYIDKCVMYFSGNRRRKLGSDRLLHHFVLSCDAKRKPEATDVRTVALPLARLGISNSIAQHSYG